MTVDGHTITFKTGATPAAAAGTSGVVIGHTTSLTDGNGNSTIDLNSGAASITDLLTAVDIATGVQTASITAGVATLTTTTGDTASTVTGGALHISTGPASDLSISSSNTSLLASLGIGSGTATTSFARTSASGSGLRLDVL